MYQPPKSEDSEWLTKIARPSPEGRTIEVLSNFGNEDAVTLWKLVGRDDLSFARRQVLQIISALLFAHKGRQALLRSGSIYAVLDLLGRHKRGAEFFTRAELATLKMLKVGKCWGEHGAFAAGVGNDAC